MSRRRGSRSKRLLKLYPEMGEHACAQLVASYWDEAMRLADGRFSEAQRLLEGEAARRWGKPSAATPATAGRAAATE